MGKSLLTTCYRIRKALDPGLVGLGCTVCWDHCHTPYYTFSYSPSSCCSAKLASSGFMCSSCVHVCIPSKECLLFCIEIA